MRLLKNSTEKMMEVLKMGVEVVEWRMISNEDKEGIKRLKIVEHFIKDFANLTQKEAKLVLEYINEKVV